MAPVDVNQHFDLEAWKADFRTACKELTTRVSRQTLTAEFLEKMLADNDEDTEEEFGNLYESIQKVGDSIIDWHKHASPGQQATDPTLDTILLEHFEPYETVKNHYKLEMRRKLRCCLFQILEYAFIAFPFSDKYERCKQIRETVAYETLEPFDEVEFKKKLQSIEGDLYSSDHEGEALLALDEAGTVLGVNIFFDMIRLLDDASPNIGKICAVTHEVLGRKSHFYPQGNYEMTNKVLACALHTLAQCLRENPFVKPEQPDAAIIDLKDRFAKKVRDQGPGQPIE